MYNVLSNPSDTPSWSLALSDAQAKHDAAEGPEKYRWLIVMGVIQQAIARGEPWPGEAE